MAKRPKQPETGTADGMIVIIDGEVVWDGEADQLGVTSKVGQKWPMKKDDLQEFEDAEDD